MKSFAKIFIIIFAPVFLIILLFFLYVKDATFRMYEELTFQNLKKMESVIYSQLDADNLSAQKYFNLKKLYDSESLRVTIIDKKSGKVLFENGVEFENIQNLGNHSDRPEVRLAVEAGEGFAMRRSNTLNTDFIYYAKSHGEYILRVAYPEFVINDAKSFMRRVLVAIILVTSFIFAVVAAFIAKKITVPVQKLNYVADMIQTGKNNIEIPDFRDPAMSKISSLIFTIYHLMLGKQKTIENEQEKNNFILSTLDEAIVLLDEKDTILHINSTFSKYFNIEGVGKNIFEATTDYETISFFKKILIEDSSPKRIVHYRKREIEMYIKSIENHNLLVFNDLTEKKNYESFKSELVANVSHELKTPLSAIMGYAETILSDADMPEDVRNKFVKKIYDSSLRLNELIEDIIKLHKLERLGDNFYIEEPFSSSEIGVELKSIYENSQKKVNISVEDGNYFVEYEHAMSVITNLIDNAIKYSKGDVVDFVMSKKGRAVTIEVADGGPVIGEDEKKRIFERFYTTSKSRNRLESGTGLGLSIVKHITGLYKGNIEILRNSRFGNTFKVCILEKRPEGNA